MSNNETNHSPSAYILIGLGLVLGLFLATVAELYIIVTVFKDASTSVLLNYVVCGLSFVLGISYAYRFMRPSKPNDPSKRKLFWLTAFCILARPAMYVILIVGIVLQLKG